MENRKKVVFIILDGLGDGPVKNGSLEKAKTPNIDKMKKEHGVCGGMMTLGKNIVPHSDDAHLVLFGYSMKKDYVGRGPYEALGAGLKMNKGDIAFRANFATVKKGVVVDRRAGRIKTEIAHKVAKHISKTKIDGHEITFAPTTEHRGVLIIKGKGLTDKINQTDPGKTGVAWIKCKPEKPTAKKTAELVNKWTEWAHEKLEAQTWTRKTPKPNFILARGVGSYKKVETIQQKFGIRSVCIAGGALYKGVAKFVGMNTPDIKGATGDKNTDLNAKFNSVINYLKTNDLVFLHIKGPDSFSHDKDCKGKKQFVEKVDKFLPKLTEKADYIIITGDHSTPCTNGDHSADPVPFLLWGKNLVPDTSSFTNLNSPEGELGIFEGKEVMKSIEKMIKN
ncbi:2,3-bisphosphoglycerate-independent phosphoglycerate mutase [Candidatus Micrarchaeota archaeon]|nr:2,3-bisphosphoglycerate-independent phosphoglycerate mutase [Candidatus Micrarchaeota archaeon]